MSTYRELVAQARERVRAHREFAAHHPTSVKLSELYDEHQRLADALETAISEMHDRELHHFEAEQSTAKAKADAFREAANDVRLVLNGGGKGKSTVWYLLDKADQIERGED